MLMHSKDNQRQAILYSYLAGIIDGEGTIRIASAKPTAKHPNWNIQFSVAISVGMSDENIIDLLVKTFGSKKRIECVLNRKTIYRWGTSGNKIVPKILHCLLPYLIVKKEQAELVLKFCEGIETKGYIRNKGLPKQELQRREELYLDVRQLNAVGAAATTKQEDTREGEVIV